MSNLLWVLQQNFYSEPNYDLLMDALPRMGMEVLRVKPVPFTHQLLPWDFDASKSSDLSKAPIVEIDVSRPIVTCGSYTLAKIGKRRGWQPGSWIDNLDYDTLRYDSGWDLLNSKVQVVNLQGLLIQEDKFIRPVEDSKAFAGQVFDPYEWKSLRDGIVRSWLACAPEEVALLPVTGHTKVVVADIQEIYVESRLFVVGGKVATQSVYKRGGRVIYDPDVDPEVLTFAKKCLDMWQPSDAFVMDIAQTPNGLKVIETNCINASGFYACDVQKLAKAIEELLC